MHAHASSLGGKLRVNHINECMPSEVDWRAHETHQKGHSITIVDWEGHDPTPYCIDGCMLYEVDWGAHDSIFLFYLVHIDDDAKPKDCFNQGLWGGLPQRTSSTTLMEYLKNSLDTRQIEDGFSNSKSIKGYTSLYFLPDPEYHEISYNLLTQWDPGGDLCNLHSSGRKAQVSSLPKYRGVTEFSQQIWVYPNPK